MKDVVYFDCEPQKNFEELKVKSHVWDLMMSIATTYSTKEDRYRIWTFSQLDDLKNYLNNSLVVGYNICGFDMPLILGETYKCDGSYKVEANGFTCECRDLFYKILSEVYRCWDFVELQTKMRKTPLVSKNVYSLLTIYSNTIGKTVSQDIYDVKSIDMFRSKKILQLVEFNMFKLRMCKTIDSFVSRFHYIVNGDFDIVRITR